MDYFNLLELPQIKGASEKQIKYATYLREKEVCSDRQYWESVACAQYHGKLDRINLDRITSIMLTCSHAGVIIDTLLNKTP